MFCAILPPFEDKIALHMDFAAAAVAVVALVSSVWSFLNQRRMSIEAMRIERDNDLIDWIDAVIDTIVDVEFLLRNWRPSVNAEAFSDKRDNSLARIAAAIDKGRLYFPNFSLDVIASDARPASQGLGLQILDGLVTIYDLINDLDLKSEKAMEQARVDLMLKKRAFIKSAQDEVEPERRLSFGKRGNLRVRKKAS